MAAATEAREPADAPRLAVIVPTLDEAGCIPKLLSALATAEGAGRPDEVVVVDGGSRDRTRELCRQAGVRVLQSPPGRGVQLAAGARAVSSEVLLFLHADHRPGPGALAVLRRAYCDRATEWTAMRQVIDSDGRFYRWVERAADARSRRGMVYGDSGLAVRREVYEAVGGFPELPLFEDVDLSVRLRQRSPVHFLAEAELHISSRRWQREGRVACTVRNWALRMAYGMGVSPATLVRFYPQGRERCEEGTSSS